MQTVNFDYAIDMSASSVFSQGFWDNESRVLYLVFENGTSVARSIKGWNTSVVEGIHSWGGIWNSTLRFLPAVELEENVQFVERTTKTDETVGSETAYSFDEDAGTLTPDEDDESAESAGPFTAQAQDALLTVSIDFDTERVASLLEAGTEFLDAAQDTVVTAVGEATEFVTGLFDRVRGNK